MRKMKMFAMAVIGMGMLCTGYGNALALAETDYTKVAENFLAYVDSGKTVSSVQPVRKDGKLVGYAMDLDGGGYVLVPATKTLPPVKAYSLNGSFSSLPKWYQDFLTGELDALQKIPAGKSRQTENKNVAKWDFLLSYDDKRASHRYRPDTFLLKTKWDQGYPYNKKLPKIGDEHVAAGCVQVAQAQVMNYHRHPETARGVATHTWNNQEFKAVLYKNYNWDIMPDVLNRSTPEYVQDELALLIHDLTITNEADYGNDGSAWTHTDAMTENFGYAMGIERMSNEDEALFFETLKKEIDNNRPVLLSLPGHATVADGYASDPTGRKIHVNMGWGGHYDDFYYLNDTVVAGSHIYEPDLDMIYNIRPCSSWEKNCHADIVKPEATDKVEGSVITGRFNSPDDVDQYEVYLKGFTKISGSTDGYPYLAFKVTIYDPATHENLDSFYYSHEGIHLVAGKYLIETAFGDEDMDYAISISTESLTSGEISATDRPPVINNEFKDRVIAEPYKIRIDAADEDGDEMSLRATSSNSHVAVTINDDILTIIPLSDGYSNIEVEARSKDKTTTEAFTVLASRHKTFFGREIVITGTFDSQEDVDRHKVVLDGSCSVEGYRGYSNQAFFTSVLNLNQNDVTGMNDEAFQFVFQRDLYLIEVSLWGYTYTPGDHDSYTLFVSCPYADTELSGVEDLLADHPPSIENDFEDMILGSPRTVTVEASDPDGDEVSVSAVSSNSDIAAVRMDGNLLTITPHAGEGQSEITVTASAYGKETAKSFVVAAAKEDVFFGKAFTIDGRFDSQDDLDNYKVVLEGVCTIQGDNGYSNQAFYTSVSDLDENYLANMNDIWINRTFAEDIYVLGSSLRQSPWGRYYFYQPGSDLYELSVGCPDADTDISVVLDMLDDAPPVINNDFDDLELAHSAAHEIVIHATDEDGDRVFLNVDSSNEHVVVGLEENVLTITSLMTEGSAEITVTASAKEQVTSKAFMVRIYDNPPVIRNAFDDLVIGREPYSMSVDTTDEDGDEVFVRAVSSDGGISVSVRGNTLTLTPLVTEGGSDITVTASSNNKAVEGTFTVAVYDNPPVIRTELKDMIIGKPCTIPIDVADEDGDQIVIRVASSDSLIGIALDDNVLMLTPHASGVYSEIGVEVSSTDKKVVRSFIVVAVEEQIFFGRHFTMDGTLNNPDEFEEHPVFLDGHCTVRDDRHELNLSVSDLSESPLAMGEPIDHEFDKGEYVIGVSSGEGFDFPHTYTLTVDCPDADTNMASISRSLGVEISPEMMRLDDAIAALQILTGVLPGTDTYTLVDINEDGQIGMAEIIYILQRVSGIR